MSDGSVIHICIVGLEASLAVHRTTHSSAWTGSTAFLKMSSTQQNIPQGPGCLSWLYGFAGARLWCTDATLAQNTSELGDEHNEVRQWLVQQQDELTHADSGRSCKNGARLYR